MKEIMDDQIYTQVDATAEEMGKATKDYYSLIQEYKQKMYEISHNPNIKHINLCRPDVFNIVAESLNIEEGKTLHTYAFTLMDSHYHWVVRIYDVDKNGRPIILPKLFSKLHSIWSRKINLLDHTPNRKVWQSEIFDTTIRSQHRLDEAIEYAINNPVNAGLCKMAKDWPYTILNVR